MEREVTPTRIDGSRRRPSRPASSTAVPTTHSPVMQHTGLHDKPNVSSVPTLSLTVPQKGTRSSFGPPAKKVPQSRMAPRHVAAAALGAKESDEASMHTITTAPGEKSATSTAPAAPASPPSASGMSPTAESLHPAPVLSPPATTPTLSPVRPPPQRGTTTAHVAPSSLHPTHADAALQPPVAPRQNKETEAEEIPVRPGEPRTAASPPTPAPAQTPDSTAGNSLDNARSSSPGDTNEHASKGRAPRSVARRPMPPRVRHTPSSQTDTAPVSKPNVTTFCSSTGTPFVASLSVPTPPRKPGGGGGASSAPTKGIQAVGSPLEASFSSTSLSLGSTATAAHAKDGNRVWLTNRPDFSTPSVSLDVPSRRADARANSLSPSLTPLTLAGTDAGGRLAGEGPTSFATLGLGSGGDGGVGEHALMPGTPAESVSQATASSRLSVVLSPEEEQLMTYFEDMEIFEKLNDLLTIMLREKPQDPELFLLSQLRAWEASEQALHKPYIPSTEYEPRDARPQLNKDAAAISATMPPSALTQPKGPRMQEGDSLGTDDSSSSTDTQRASPSASSSRPHAPAAAAAAASEEHPLDAQAALNALYFPQEQLLSAHLSKERAKLQAIAEAHEEERRLAEEQRLAALERRRVQRAELQVAQDAVVTAEQARLECLMGHPLAVTATTSTLADPDSDVATVTTAVPFRLLQHMVSKGLRASSSSSDVDANNKPEMGFPSSSCSSFLLRQRSSLHTSPSFCITAEGPLHHETLVPFTCEDTKLQARILHHMATVEASKHRKNAPASPPRVSGVEGKRDLLFDGPRMAYLAAHEALDSVCRRKTNDGPARTDAFTQFRTVMRLSHLFLAVLTQPVAEWCRLLRLSLLTMVGVEGCQIVPWLAEQAGQGLRAVARRELAALTVVPRPSHRHLAAMDPAEADLIAEDEKDELLAMREVALIFERSMHVLDTAVTLLTREAVTLLSDLEGQLPSLSSISSLGNQPAAPLLDATTTPTVASGSSSSNNNNRPSPYEGTGTVAFVDELTRLFARHADTSTSPAVFTDRRGPVDIPQLIRRIAGISVGHFQSHLLTSRNSQLHTTAGRSLERLFPALPKITCGEAADLTLMEGLVSKEAVAMLAAVALRCVRPARYEGCPLGAVPLAQLPLSAEKEAYARAVFVTRFTGLILHHQRHSTHTLLQDNILKPHSAACPSLLSFARHLLGENNQSNAGGHAGSANESHKTSRSPATSFGHRTEARTDGGSGSTTVAEAVQAHLPQCSLPDANVVVSTLVYLVEGTVSLPQAFFDLTRSNVLVTQLGQLCQAICTHMRDREQRSRVLLFSRWMRWLRSCFLDLCLSEATSSLHSSLTYHLAALSGQRIAQDQEEQPPAYLQRQLRRLHVLFRQLMNGNPTINGMAATTRGTYTDAAGLTNTSVHGDFGVLPEDRTSFLSRKGWDYLALERQRLHNPTAWFKMLVEKASAVDRLSLGAAEIQRVSSVALQHVAAAVDLICRHVTLEQHRREKAEADGTLASHTKAANDGLLHRASAGVKGPIARQGSRAASGASAESPKRPWAGGRTTTTCSSATSTRNGPPDQDDVLPQAHTSRWEALFTVAPAPPSDAAISKTQGDASLRLSAAAADPTSTPLDHFLIALARTASLVASALLPLATAECPVYVAKTAQHQWASLGGHLQLEVVKAATTGDIAEVQRFVDQHTRMRYGSVSIGSTQRKGSLETAGGDNADPRGLVDVQGTQNREDDLTASRGPDLDHSLLHPTIAPTLVPSYEEDPDMEYHAKRGRSVNCLRNHLTAFFDKAASGALCMEGLYDIVLSLLRCNVLPSTVRHFVELLQLAMSGLLCNDGVRANPFDEADVQTLPSTTPYVSFLARHTILPAITSFCQSRGNGPTLYTQHAVTSQVDAAARRGAILAVWEEFLLDPGSNHDCLAALMDRMPSAFSQTNDMCELREHLRNNTQRFLFHPYSARAAPRERMALGVWLLMHEQIRPPTFMEDATLTMLQTFVDRRFEEDEGEDVSESASSEDESSEEEEEEETATQNGRLGRPNGEAAAQDMARRSKVKKAEARAARIRMRKTVDVLYVIQHTDRIYRQIIDFSQPSMRTAEALHSLLAPLVSASRGQEAYNIEDLSANVVAGITLTQLRYQERLYSLTNGAVTESCRHASPPLKRLVLDMAKRVREASTSPKTATGTQYGVFFGTEWFADLVRSFLRSVATVLHIYSEMNHRDQQDRVVYSFTVLFRDLVTHLLTRGVTVVHLHELIDHMFNSILERRTGCAAGADSDSDEDDEDGWGRGSGPGSAYSGGGVGCTDDRTPWLHFAELLHVILHAHMERPLSNNQATLTPIVELASRFLQPKSDDDSDDDANDDANKESLLRHDAPPAPRHASQRAPQQWSNDFMEFCIQHCGVQMPLRPLLMLTHMQETIEALPDMHGSVDAKGLGVPSQKLQEGDGWGREYVQSTDQGNPLQQAYHNHHSNSVSSGNVTKHAGTMAPSVHTSYPSLSTSEAISAFFHQRRSMGTRGPDVTAPPVEPKDPSSPQDALAQAYHAVFHFFCLVTKGKAAAALCTAMGITAAAVVDGFTSTGTSVVNRSTRSGRSLGARSSVRSSNGSTEGRSTTVGRSRSRNRVRALQALGEEVDADPLARHGSRILCLLSAGTSPVGLEILSAFGVFVLSKLKPPRSCGQTQREATSVSSAPSSTGTSLVSNSCTEPYVWSRVMAEVSNATCELLARDFQGRPSSAAGHGSLAERGLPGNAAQLDLSVGLQLLRRVEAALYLPGVADALHYYGTNTVERLPPNKQSAPATTAFVSAFDTPNAPTTDAFPNASSPSAPRSLNTAYFSKLCRILYEFMLVCDVHDRKRRRQLRKRVCEKLSRVLEGDTTAELLCASSLLIATLSARELARTSQDAATSEGATAAPPPASASNSPGMTGADSLAPSSLSQSRPSYGSPIPLHSLPTVLDISTASRIPHAPERSLFAPSTQSHSSRRHVPTPPPPAPYPALSADPVVRHRQRLASMTALAQLVHCRTHQLILAYEHYIMQTLESVALHGRRCHAVTDSLTALVGSTLAGGNGVTHHTFDASSPLLAEVLMDTQLRTSMEILFTSMRTILQEGRSLASTLRTAAEEMRWVSVTRKQRRQLQLRYTNLGGSSLGGGSGAGHAITAAGALLRSGNHHTGRSAGAPSTTTTARAPGAIAAASTAAALMAMDGGDSVLVRQAFSGKSGGIFSYRSEEIIGFLQACGMLPRDVFAMADALWSAAHGRRPAGETGNEDDEDSDGSQEAFDGDTSDDGDLSLLESRGSELGSRGVVRGEESPMHRQVSRASSLPAPSASPRAKPEVKAPPTHPEVPLSHEKTAALLWRYYLCRIGSTLREYAERGGLRVTTEDATHAREVCALQESLLIADVQRRALEEEAATTEQGTHQACRSVPVVAEEDTPELALEAAIAGELSTAPLKAFAPCPRHIRNALGTLLEVTRGAVVTPASTKGDGKSSTSCDHIAFPAEGDTAGGGSHATARTSAHASAPHSERYGSGHETHHSSKTLSPLPMKGNSTSAESTLFDCVTLVPCVRRMIYLDPLHPTTHVFLDTILHTLDVRSHRPVEVADGVAGSRSLSASRTLARGAYAAFMETRAASLAQALRALSPASSQRNASWAPMDLYQRQRDLVNAWKRCYACPNPTLATAATSPIHGVTGSSSTGVGAQMQTSTSSSVASGAAATSTCGYTLAHLLREQLWGTRDALLVEHFLTCLDKVLRDKLWVLFTSVAAPHGQGSVDSGRGSGGGSIGSTGEGPEQNPWTVSCILSACATHISAQDRRLLLHFLAYHWTLVTEALCVTMASNGLTPASQLDMLSALRALRLSLHCVCVLVGAGRTWSSHGLLHAQLRAMPFNDMLEYVARAAARHDVLQPLFTHEKTGPSSSPQQAIGGQAPSVTVQTRGGSLKSDDGGFRRFTMTLLTVLLRLRDTVTAPTFAVLSDSHREEEEALLLLVSAHSAIRSALAPATTTAASSPGTEVIHRAVYPSLGGADSSTFSTSGFGSEIAPTARRRTLQHHSLTRISDANLREVRDLYLGASTYPSSTRPGTHHHNHHHHPIHQNLRSVTPIAPTTHVRDGSSTRSHLGNSTTSVHDHSVNHSTGAGDALMDPLAWTEHSRNTQLTFTLLQWAAEEPLLRGSNAEASVATLTSLLQHTEVVLPLGGGESYGSGAPGSAGAPYGNTTAATGACAETPRSPCSPPQDVPSTPAPRPASDAPLCTRCRHPLLQCACQDPPQQLALLLFLALALSRQVQHLFGEQEAGRVLGAVAELPSNAVQGVYLAAMRGTGTCPSVALTGYGMSGTATAVVPPVTAATTAFSLPAPIVEECLRMVTEKCGFGGRPSFRAGAAGDGAVTSVLAAPAALQDSGPSKGHQNANQTDSDQEEDSTEDGFRSGSPHRSNLGLASQQQSPAEVQLRNLLSSLYSFLAEGMRQPTQVLTVFTVHRPVLLRQAALMLELDYCGFSQLCFLFLSTLLKCARAQLTNDTARGLTRLTTTLCRSLHEPFTVLDAAREALRQQQQPQSASPMTGDSGRGLSPHALTSGTGTHASPTSKDNSFSIGLSDILKPSPVQQAPRQGGRRVSANVLEESAFVEGPLLPSAEAEAAHAARHQARYERVQAHLAHAFPMVEFKIVALTWLSWSDDWLSLGLAAATHFTANYGERRGGRQRSPPMGGLLQQHFLLLTRLALRLVGANWPSVELVRSVVADWIDGMLGWEAEGLARDAAISFAHAVQAVLAARENTREGCGGGNEVEGSLYSVPWVRRAWHTTLTYLVGAIHTLQAEREADREAKLTRSNYVMQLQQRMGTYNRAGGNSTTTTTTTTAAANTTSLGEGSLGKRAMLDTLTMRPTSGTRSTTTLPGWRAGSSGSSGSLSDDEESVNPNQQSTTQYGSTGHGHSTATLKRAGSRFALRRQQSTRSLISVSTRRGGSVASVNAEEPPLAIITERELAAAHTPQRSWTAIEGVVYDITRLIRTHPGGVEVLVENAAGQDCTEVFSLQHGNNKAVLHVLEKLRVGILETALTGGS